MVQKSKFDFEGEEWDNVSSEAKNLIKNLITKPERRLTAEEALQHKWIKNLTSKKQDTKLIGKLSISTMKSF
jgi:calcium-dependent protein kinase